MAHIIHVVLLEWGLATPEHIKASARSMLRAFPAQIDGIVSLAEGASVSAEELEDGLDYGFVVTFVDAAARDSYLPHPVHVELAELLRSYTTRVFVYDLESDEPTLGGS